MEVTSRHLTVPREPVILILPYAFFVLALLTEKANEIIFRKSVRKEHANFFVLLLCVSALAWYS